MNNPEQAVNPQMVILGRESRGLSQQALSEMLGITQGRISKIEAGILPVTQDVLEGLSRTLDYPMHFFAQDGGLFGVGISEVFHRKRQDVPKKTLMKAYAQMEVRIRHVRALLRVYDIPCSVRRIDVDEYGGRADDIAKLVRANWNLPRGPILDMIKTLEDAGVLVIAMNFETPRIDALSRWVPGLPPIFFINERSPKDRTRLTLAHELGHMVMHEFPSPEAEKQANLFAAEFLLPTRDVRSDLDNLTLPRLTVLKRYWRVSMAAILYRAEELGAISSNRARYLWVQMASAGYKTREPIELDIEGERPSLLYELVNTHRNDLGYSVTDLKKLIPLNDHELWSEYIRTESDPPLRMIRAM